MPPWTKAGAKRHTRKANTAKKQRQWQHVAKSMSERGYSEGRAIRAANSVVKRGAGRSKRRSRRA